jgi:hypothetical protein
MDSSHADNEESHEANPVLVSQVSGSILKLQRSRVFLPRLGLSSSKASLSLYSTFRLVDST